MMGQTLAPVAFPGPVNHQGMKWTSKGFVDQDSPNSVHWKTWRNVCLVTSGPLLPFLTPFGGHGT